MNSHCYWPYSLQSSPGIAIALENSTGFCSVFSERELKFRFAICRRPSVCRLSSVTFVRPTQAIEIFGNIFTPRGTLAIRDLCIKFYGDRRRGTPPAGVKPKRGSKI